MISLRLRLSNIKTPSVPPLLSHNNISNFKTGAQSAHVWGLWGFAIFKKKKEWEWHVLKRNWFTNTEWTDLLPSDEIGGERSYIESPRQPLHEQPPRFSVTIHTSFSIDTEFNVRGCHVSVLTMSLCTCLCKPLGRVWTTGKSMDKP